MRLLAAALAILLAYLLGRVSGRASGRTDTRILDLLWRKGGGDLRSVIIYRALEPLGVSIPEVHESLDRLEQSGLVTVRHGPGGEERGHKPQRLARIPIYRSSHPFIGDDPEGRCDVCGCARAAHPSGVTPDVT